MNEEYLNDKDFYFIIEDLLNNRSVQEMKKYRHHFETTCYDHCICVSYYAYKWAKKWNADYKSAARAGMLHDLFLYDWRKPRPDGKGLHAFRHPRIALNNALKEFDLNVVEQDAILKHMWPLTIILPKYKVSYIITLADKYATFLDNVSHCKKNNRTKMS